MDAIQSKKEMNLQLNKQQLEKFETENLKKIGTKKFARLPDIPVFKEKRFGLFYLTENGNQEYLASVNVDFDFNTSTSIVSYLYHKEDNKVNALLNILI